LFSIRIFSFDDNNFSFEADLIQNYEKQLKNRNKEISKCDEEFSEIKERTEIVQAFYYSPKERKGSNDTLSINGSQAETLSQTSESSFFLSFPNSNKSQLNSSKENILIENKQNMNVPYYFGVEEYYQKLMPEKFTEYKNTKNYLPKYPKKIRTDESSNTLDQSKSKEMNQNPIKFQYPNYLPFPYYGIFCQFNPIIFNHFSKVFTNNQKNRNRNNNKKIIKKNSDDDKPIKEENQENKIYDKNDEKKEEKKDEKKDNKNEERRDQNEKKVQKQQKQYYKNQNTFNKNNYKRNTDKEFNYHKNSNYNNYSGQYKKNYRKNYNYKYDHYNYYDYNDNYQNERSFYNNNYHKRRNHNMYESQF